MAFIAFVTGTLHKDIEKKVSKTGKDFCGGTVKYLVDGQPHYVRFSTFDATAIAALENARAGDAVAVSGLTKFDLWTPENGEPRININLLADRALVKGLTEKKPRPRPAPTAAQTYRRQSKHMIPAPEQGGGTDPRLDDPIGF